MTKIKICGLRRTEDIEAVNAYMPDWCGFILSRPYRRFVDMAALRTLRSRLKPGIPAVGVFVNETAEYISQYVQEGLIDIIQLHGSETDEMICLLKQMFPAVPVIQAFTIKDTEDLKQAEQSVADLVLLDAGKGSGLTFDWSLCADMKRPFLLAGGLDPQNLPEALKQVRPYGADISSGAETDGAKDPEKIRRLIEIAHTHNGEMI